MENLKSKQIQSYIEILQLCISYFEYKPTTTIYQQQQIDNVSSISLSSVNKTTKFDDQKQQQQTQQQKQQQYDTCSIRSTTTMSNSLIDNINLKQQQQKRISLTEEKLDFTTTTNSMTLNKVKWRSNEQITIKTNQKGTLKQRFVQIKIIFNFDLII